MQITTPNLAFLFSSVEHRFWGAFTSAPKFYDALASVIPSSTEQNVYGWMGQIPKPRIWTGSRTVHTPAPETYLVANKPIEDTLSLSRFKIEDDSYGIYLPMAGQLGTMMSKAPDYFLRDLIFAQGDFASTVLQNGLDGGPHWSATHAVDIYDASKGTYCNDFRSGGVSVNGVTVGGALAPTPYRTLWEEMSNRKGQSGEPLGITPNLLVVPPQLKFVGETLLQTQFFAPQAWGGTTMVGSTENVLRGSSDLKVVPEFGQFPTTWLLLDTAHGDVKPFVWQERTATEFAYRISPTDPAVFDQALYIYGALRRGAPAWSHAFLSSISGA